MKETLRDQYIDLLKHHDWYYDYSDDYSVWKRGSDEYREIVRLRDKVDQDHALYNQYAPKDE